MSMAGDEENEEIQNGSLSKFISIDQRRHLHFVFNLLFVTLLSIQWRVSGIWDLEDSAAILFQS